jgi:hypothetical protein
MQNNVKKCYGCNQDFTYTNTVQHHCSTTAQHHCSSYWFILIEEFGVWINNGAIQYGADFTNTYYHCDFSHIAKKNPYFDGTVYASSQLHLTPDQQSVIMAGKLKVTFC